jgi:hypothetical protein
MALKFPSIPGIVYPVQETLIDKVYISNFANRAEQRRQAWSQPYHIFPIKCRGLKDDFLRVWEFYQLCRGPYKSFQFQNGNDLWFPLSAIDAYWALNEAEGTKVDDRHSYINPTYNCRFLDEKLSFEQINFLLFNSGLDIVQVDPLTIVNNYGTLSGTATWIECPDYSAGVNFDGSSGQASMGDAALLDVGTGDFSLALGFYANSLSAQVRVLSKKTDATASNKGYHLLISTAGTMTFVFSDGTQKTVTSAVGAIINQTWYLITITISRAGNGQIYINNVASGAAVAMGTSVNADNANNFYLGRAEGIGYGNCRLHNVLFQKKVWTSDERDKIWSILRRPLGI